MEELLKDLREVCEKHKMEVKFGQSPIEVKRVNYRHRISDDTHDKVYELNKQMCDLEIDRDRWEKKDDERKGEILEEIAKLGGKISDLIEEYGGDVIVEIDQYEVILRDCGDILYRK